MAGVPSDKPVVTAGVPPVRENPLEKLLLAAVDAGALKLKLLADAAAGAAVWSGALMADARILPVPLGAAVLAKLNPPALVVVAGAPKLNPVESAVGCEAAGEKLKLAPPAGAAVAVPKLNPLLVVAAAVVVVVVGKLKLLVLPVPPLPPPPKLKAILHDENLKRNRINFIFIVGVGGVVSGISKV